MAGIEEMQTEDIGNDKLMDAVRKQEMEENKERNENKDAKKGENGEHLEVNTKKTAKEKEFDGKEIMAKTKPEVRAHPPPAALTAVFSKVEEEEKINAGGGKTACLLKGHVESTAQEGREEAEQSAGEGPSGKRQPAGGENHGKGSGGGKDEGTKDGKSGKKEGKEKEGLGKEKVVRRKGGCVSGRLYTKFLWRVEVSS
ncbi:hypothetical protein CesoFtcFv8_024738 [Champsocephalus esox]|uniref:Uncharacterized protein n=1 Tax=Champsocephalus esox TaxID=159716 RepID=A0AAN8GHE2_9TELE|nr:hypothetical protein CesoFtcFv8_024738 [Champsocephalus esox]